MEAVTTPIEERRADPAAQLEIDEGILDYIVYKATKVLLHDIQKSHGPLEVATRKSTADLHLNMVGSFLVMYHALHAGYRGGPALQLRLQLLRFATMFTKRQPAKELRPWVQGLDSLRCSRHEKANAFRPTVNVPDLGQYLEPSDKREWIEREHVSQTKATKSLEEKEKASLPLVSLLDTIPSFMALSAAANVMQESKITDTWMRLAAGYMAQAVVEQYLVYGYWNDEVVKEAFGWGFDPDTVAEEGSNDWIVNAMFLDEEAEFKSWRSIRDEHMVALVPPEGSDLLEHLNSLRVNELSLSAFENTILQFLKGLLQSLPKPILLRLEPAKFGRLSNSRYDTQALREMLL